MRRAIAALSVLPLALAGCGDAAAATRSFQASDFVRLRVEGPFDVRVRSGGAAAVRATGPQAAIDRLLVEQNGETLVIRPSRTVGWTNWSFGDQPPMVVDVTTRALAAAALGGSGRVAIDRLRGPAAELVLAGSGDVAVADVAVDRLKLSASGSGTLTVAGRARAADVALVGSGDIRAGQLTADAATVRLTGSGDVALAARREAAITLTGSGDVAVAGQARCTVTRTGSGSVACAGGR